MITFAGQGATPTNEEIVMVMELPRGDALSPAELDRFLAAQDEFSSLTSLSRLDGYLAALAIGPAWVPPEVWLSYLWAGFEPAFRDAQEKERVLNTIRARHDRIVRQLKEDPANYEPVLGTREDGAVTVADWAVGFAIGSGGRPLGDWTPLFRAEENDHEALLEQLPDYRDAAWDEEGGYRRWMPRPKARQLVLDSILRIRRFCGTGTAPRGRGQWGVPAMS
jgi:yecA family protein